MEWKIGEIKQVNGEWYQCVKSDGTCNGCVGKFQSYSLCNEFDECVGKIFKKLEKVGEPYEFDGHLFQSYRTFEVPIFTENYATVRELGNNSKISIEIKQNKEDMEEKEQCGDNRFEVIEKAKKHLLSSTNIESSKEEMKVLDNFLIRCWQMGWLDKYNDTKHSNSEKVGKNLGPFDLQKAREGKPVCTRDGRKVRIVCFDRISGDDYYKIVACVTAFDGDFEEVLFYGIDGYIVDSQNPKDEDLMMLPEKKEGWINIYKEELLGARIYSTKEEAINNSEKLDYIDTIRVEWEE